MAKRGRPKGALNKDKPYRAALIRALERRDPDTLNNIADKCLDDCEHEDEGVRSAARRELADRLDGKPHQQIDADVRGDVNTNVTFTWDDD